MRHNVVNVLFWAPFYFTTSGHKAIYSYFTEVVNSELKELDLPPWVIVPCTSQKLAKFAECFIDTPRILVLDWPWAAVITSLPPEFRSGFDRILALSMASTLQQTEIERLWHEGDANTSPLVDCVVQLEPTNHSPGTHQSHAHAHPLVRAENATLPTEEETRYWSELTKARRPGQRTVLVMQSGYETERERLAEQVAHDFPNDFIVLSRGLQTARPVRFTPLADIVVAVPGYSTFWELATLTQLVPMTIKWYHFYRPVEDVSKRLQLSKEAISRALETQTTLTEIIAQEIKNVSRSSIPSVGGVDAG